VINGIPVSRGEVLFFLENEISSHEILHGGTLDWESEAAGRPLAQYLKDAALQSLIMSTVAETNTAALGITLAPDDVAHIEASFQYEITALGGWEHVERMLQSSGLSEEAYIRHLYRTPILLGRLYENLFGAGGIMLPSHQETRDFFFSRFARASYLMLPAVDTDGVPLPEAQRQALRETMHGYEARLRGGADFVSLIFEAYGNSGILDAPVHTYIAPGVMEPEFEAALFALPIGGTSAVIETASALYIIRRLPLEDSYLEENFEAVRRACANTWYIDLLNSWIENADVATTPVFDRIDVPSFATRG
jgi:hypothetical protein